MPIVIPTDVQKALDEADQSSLDVDEVGLAGRLKSIVRTSTPLTPEERKGMFSEVGGFTFMHLGERANAVWDMYWQPQGSAITTKGETIYFPDFKPADEEVIDYWLLRSAQATHPVMKARYA